MGPTEERDRSHTNAAAAARGGWVVDKGNPDVWELVVKAHNDDAQVMKSTKRMAVPGGWLYCVTTEKGDQVAEALAFVPSPS